MIEVVFGIIAAAFVSAVVSLVIRKIDRNENSMENIKRYANLRKNDFEAYFKDEKDKLKLLASDLDAKNIQAKAAVKRLQMQYEDFEKNSADLEKPVAAVRDIGEKIHSYDTLVSNLMQMTSAVEENLRKIKAEAGIVEKLGQKLDTVKKSVDETEKRIPEVVRQFSSKNAEQLKAIGSDLLERYEKRAGELDSSTKESLNRAASIMKKN